MVPITEETVFRYGLGKLYSVSYVLYDGIGITIVMLVAIPVSYLTGEMDC